MSKTAAAAVAAKSMYVRNLDRRSEPSSTGDCLFRCSYKNILFASPDIAHSVTQNILVSPCPASLRIQDVAAYGAVVEVVSICEGCWCSSTAGAGATALRLHPVRDKGIQKERRTRKDRTQRQRQMQRQRQRQKDRWTCDVKQTGRLSH